MDLNDSDEFESHRCDVTDADATRAVIDGVESTYGNLSAVVTAAGTWHETLPFTVDEHVFNGLAAVHLAGTLNAIYPAVEIMRARGRGRVVTITTDLALSGNPDDTYYVTLKGALLAFTRCLAHELLAANIFVNTVAPGATDTPILPPDSPWRTAEKLASLPLPRLVSPDEIAEAVARLCRDDWKLTGQIISPNAGQAI